MDSLRYFRCASSRSPTAFRRTLQRVNRPSQAVTFSYQKSNNVISGHLHVMLTRN